MLFSLKNTDFLYSTLTTEFIYGYYTPLYTLLDKQWLSWTGCVETYMLDLSIASKFKVHIKKLCLFYVSLDRNNRDLKKSIPIYIIVTTNIVHTSGDTK